MDNATEENRHTTQIQPEQCAERSWCNMADYPSEHPNRHASDIVYLAGAKPSTPETEEKGWWCWLTEDRDGHRFDLVMEGRVDGKLFETEIPVADVAMLLLAVATPEAFQALENLIEQAKA